MQLFRYSDKEGPGVPKNEKEKTGFSLFFYIVRHNAFGLVLLNIVFVLCCIPVVTIGPAFKALDKVTMDLVRRQSVSPVRDFFTEFKEGFVRSMLVGLLFLLLIGACVMAFLLFPSEGLSETGLFVTGSIALLVVLLVLAVGTYTFKAMGTINHTVGTTLKNALLLMLVSLKELILMFVLTILPTYLIGNIIYIGVPLFFLVVFSYNSLVTSVIGWRVIKKYIVLTDSDEDEKTADTAAE